MSYNRAVKAALLLLFAVLPARADIGIEREEWRVVGWNDACGVAFVHLSYPKFGEAIHGEHSGLYSYELLRQLGDAAAQS